MQPLTKEYWGQRKSIVTYTQAVDATQAYAWQETYRMMKATFLHLSATGPVVTVTAPKCFTDASIDN